MSELWKEKHNCEGKKKSIFKEITIKIEQFKF